MRRRTAALAAATILALSGCAAPQQPASAPITPAAPPRATEAAPAPTAAPTVAVATAPSPTPAPTAAASPAAAPAAAPSPAGPAADGQTYPGPYFLGRPDAPITIEEYADFQ